MGYQKMPTVPVASLNFRKQFHNATKREFETAHDWYIRLKRLSEYCQYGDAENMFLLDKLIIGLDDKIFERLCEQVECLSLEQSMTLAGQFEEEFKLIQVRYSILNIYFKPLVDPLFDDN